MASNPQFSGNNQGLQVGTNEGSITFNQSQSDQEIDRLCLRQLRCPDSRLMKNILKESKDKLRRESFEWILRDPKYESWRDGDEVCLLWIKGGAGKGKTMISIGLIEELLQFCKNTSSVMTYFFCQNANSELNTLEGLLKGLILQLINQRPALKECLRSRWDTVTSSFDRDLTSWRALWHLLLEMMEKCDCSKIYLVVDALDECQDDDVEEFLKALVMNGLHSPDRCGVKWLFTSRPLDSAERTLLAGYDQVQMSLELESHHLAKAVQSYITSKVNELSHRGEYERRLKEQVESQLLQKCEETFLWVSLVCKRLEEVSTDEVLVTIENTPHGLRPLYGQAFEQLSCGKTKKIKMCMRLLKVMMLVYRPLKMGEFAAVAGFQDGEDVALISLITRCASFLRLREQNVEFVHQSARDYLAEESQQLTLDSHGRYGHWDIALNCISHLSQSLKVNLLNLPPDAKLKTVDTLRTENKTLVLDNLEYAAAFWGQHVHDGDGIYPWSHAIDKGCILEFLYTKLLEWLECLGLLDMLPVAVGTLQRLEYMLKNEPMPLSFVNDATRFLFRHFDTVEEWPLQVYVSAVIWSPGSSLVRKRNLERVPWLRNVAPLEATWGPRKLRFSREIDHRAQSKISSDGKLLVTVCGRLDYKLSSAIYVWDIAAKIMAWEFFSGSTQNIRELGFSQDNKRILWIAEVDSVHSWEISSDDVRATPVEFPGFGEIVALSSAGMQVASIVSGHGILIWDTLTGKIRVKVSLSYPEYEKSIFFSLNDTQIMCEVSGQEVCIWDTTTGRLKERLVKPPDFLHSLAHSPDGIHICYRSPEAEILFWNTQNGHVRRLEGCTCREQRPVISPDVKKVTYQHGLYTYVWDFFTGEVRKFLYVGSFQDPMEKAFSPINNSLVYLTYDGDIHVEYLEASSFECWEYWGARKKILSSHMYDEIPIHAAFSHDGKRVVLCGGAESNFTIVDARTGVTEKTIPLPVDIEERITAAKFLPRDEKIVVARKGHIMVWESADKGFRLKRGDTVSTISHSPDGKYLAGIINDREIRIWNMQTGALIMTTKDRSTDFLRCLAFSPDGKRIASYASYTAPLDVNMPPMLTLNVWDISQSLHTSNPFGRALNKHIRGIKPKKIELQPSWCRDILEFSSDGCYLLTGQGPIMVSNIVSEGDSLTADLPSLYIDEHCDDPDKNLWIFWGKQPFIRIAFHSLVVDRYLGMYGLDVQGGKIIFQYRYPEMLILDVDTKVLTETLSSHDYPSV